MRCVMKPTSVLKIHDSDTVAVALNELNLGDTALGISVVERIPYLHKVALQDIPAGSVVLKYGQPIGVARKDIAKGEWVHTHNLGMCDVPGEYEYATHTPPPPTPVDGGTFMGYLRSDGRVGTRNYIAVISTVNCSATASSLVAERITPDILARYPNVDGVIALTHSGGCGLANGTEDHTQLKRTLAGLANHPNIAAYVMIGLGCEVGHPAFMEDDGLIQLGNLTGDGMHGQPVPERVNGPLLISLQSHGGTEATVAAAVDAICKLLPQVNAEQRQPLPVSKLKIALNCGGSDAASGLTANPAVGHASDLFVAAGATVILAETPETLGAEGLLAARAATAEVGKKLVERIEWWKKYVAMFGAVLEPAPTLDANPATGNKEGGLTTIREKSLGAATKGGTTALQGVCLYGETVPGPGFFFMDTPGTDWVSMTGLAAGGAQLGVFTTGRGSCYGNMPMPTLKVATNTPMYNRMRGDMDLNAGVILEGTSVNEVGKQIYDGLIAMASGLKSRSEILGYGRKELEIWKIGPQM